MAVGWRSPSLFLVTWSCPRGSSQHGNCLHQRKQVRKARECSKTEITVFCNLISKVTSQYLCCILFVGCKLVALDGIFYKRWVPGVREPLSRLMRLLITPGSHSFAFKLAWGAAFPHPTSSWALAPFAHNRSTEWSWQSLSSFWKWHRILPSQKAAASHPSGRVPGNSCQEGTETGCGT